MVPKISVIIPVYNTEQYLPACLDSVVGQTLGEIEIICINDGSTDGSPDILQDYARRDARITVRSQPNGRQGKARNLGISLAQGEYLYFMDSDDLLELTALEEAYSRCQAQSLDLLFFDRDLFADDPAVLEEFLRTHTLHYPTKPYEGVFTGPELFARLREDRVWSVSPCLYLVRRSLVEGAHLRFPESILHEDQFFAMAMVLSAPRAGHLLRKLFHRRFRDDSTMTSAPSIRNVDGYYQSYLMLMRFLDRTPLDPEPRQAAVAQVRQLLANARTIYLSLTPPPEPSTDPMFRAAVEDWCALERRRREAVENLNQANERRDQLIDQLQQTRERCGALDARLKQAWAEKSEVNAKLKQTYDEKFERGVEIKALRAELADTKRALKETKAELKQTRAALKQAKSTLGYRIQRKLTGGKK